MAPQPEMVITTTRILLLISFLCFVQSLPASEPPGPQQRLEAIGSIKSLPEALQRAFTPANDFEPVPRPRPLDWLAVHREQGQTYDQFQRSRPNRPDAQRKIIYLQPLGAFPEGQSPSLEKLRAPIRVRSRHLTNGIESGDALSHR